MTKIFLSVIIPCYNEQENLERRVLNEVYDYLIKQKYSWEIIISDDGSDDNSRGITRRFIKGKKGIVLLEGKHGGKPYAIRKGIEKAGGEYCLFVDMDLSTPINQIDKFQPFFGSYELVIGSRGLKRKNFSLLRKFGSLVFIVIRKAILLGNINDTQCGFKAIRTDVARKIFPLLQFFKEEKLVVGWKVTSVDVELLFIADKLGYKIKEVPVVWEDKDITKGKKRSYISESKEMLTQILRVKLNDLRGMYVQK